MEKLLSAEILVPIIVNTILAITTIFYLFETRSTRKAIVNQFRMSQRQHFIATAPFLYFGSIKKIEGTLDFAVKLTNASDKLARDVSCIIYDNQKKTFCYPNTTKVVIKPSASSTLEINENPRTAAEVKKRLCEFYEINEEVFSHLINESKKSYALIFYTDLEGAVYSVKSGFSWNEDDTIIRGRSKFKKLSDPQPL
ncbi:MULTISPECIES: hypothetical protein [unclassified Duganella]|uniref:hypothetical protein n=1 Tax=unclassified Duganella TaxID=2636909 RepID=UPI00088D3B17|nr:MULTISPECIES: hypothetical protein [unclassified Duganella]SDG54427.1 hypothetical protein SAMN05216320_105152 [Duganella sp. OV458]SDJ77049.1 hypothetical protein SAMN05428973_106153 [Duganella sp. OV510]